MKKVKVEFIKERKSAGFKVGDIVEFPENKATRYIAQGLAKLYVPKKRVEKLETKEEPKEKLTKKGGK